MPKTYTTWDNTPLPLLPLPLRRGARASPWKDCSTLSITSVVGASYALLLNQRRQDNKIKHNNKTDTTQNTGSNDDKTDIWQPNTAVVYENTKLQFKDQQWNHCSDTNFVTTRTYRSMTGTREWEYIKYPKPIVSLENFSRLKH